MDERTANTEDVESTQFLSAEQCRNRYGFSKRHWLRLVSSGEAPNPIQFGRLQRWALAELQSWEAAKRIAAKGKGK